jgi:hypothetical protein
MGRKTKTVTVPHEGRDKGKMFVLVEMPASVAEEWAQRALEAVAQRSEVPAGVANAGMLGIFILGLKPVLSAPFAMVKPLLREMFERCLVYVPDASKADIIRGAVALPFPDGRRPVGPLLEEDIEEVVTRVWLRDQIFELHTDFSVAAVLSHAWARVEAAAAIWSASQSTQTSPGQSAPPSPETPH